MNRSTKQLKLLDSLRLHEKNNHKFSIKDLVNSTGYNENSIRKYINEKLNGVYLHPINEKEWRCDGLLKLSNDDFIRMMSQSLKAKTVTPELKIYKGLLKRSLDAFILSLEVYNRPSLDNRVEAFCILSINAWELLLKAELIKALSLDTVFKSSGHSISISDALNKRLQQNDPVRKNLETLVELRDSAIHLLIPELQPELSRLFQANVLNYQQRYLNETGSSPLSGQSIGMLSLVIDGPQSDISIIKENYGSMTAAVAEEFLGRFNKNASEYDSVEFTIPVDYKLTLTKNTKESDLALGIGEKGHNAIIIREVRDPDITHPYYEGTAIERINNQQSEFSITRYSFRAVISKHKVQNNKKSPMHFEIDKRHRYSEKFVIWFVDSLKQPEWLDDAISYLKNKKGKKTAS
ncbi:DUF3644 domain-containing protein [Serratia marcescens]|uniref:DUF3644 domain-containing protein n=1 Tax=Serratia marcescens TaxID=615 RepID=UPI003B893E96